MNVLAVASCFLLFIFGCLILYEVVLQQMPSRDPHGTVNEIGEIAVGQMSLAYNEDCAICAKEEAGKFHLVTTFFPVTNPHFGKKVDENFFSDSMSNEDMYVFLNQRILELMDVVQRNLNHPLITALHIVFSHPSTILTILKHRLENKDKLIFHQLPKTDKEVTYKDIFLYVQTYLLNIPVIIANQDIYLGSGFGLINAETLRTKKVAYALSRKGTKERYCHMDDNCQRGQVYLGSHDSFVFVLTHKIEKRKLKILANKVDEFGAENVLIHFMIKVLQLKVLNPCFQLKTYHVHCKAFHNKDRKRINKKSNSGWIPFSDSLE